MSIRRPSVNALTHYIQTQVKDWKGENINLFNIISRRNVVVKTKHILSIPPVSCDFILSGLTQSLVK